MKKIFFCILLLLLSVSCFKYKHYRLEGMWQLKTVQDTNGNTVQVDTVFYSFQREALFSFTLLENPKEATIFYGYVDMPADNKVHVKIDRNMHGNDDFEWFLSLSGWSSADLVFDIENNRHENLVLFDSENGKRYTFKKY